MKPDVLRNDCTTYVAIAVSNVFPSLIVVSASLRIVMIKNSVLVLDF